MWYAQDVRRTMDKLREIEERLGSAISGARHESPLSDIRYLLERLKKAECALKEIQRINKDCLCCSGECGCATPMGKQADAYFEEIE